MSSHSATSSHGTNVVVIAKEPEGALIPREVISQIVLRSRTSALILPTIRSASPMSPGKIGQSRWDVRNATDARYKTIPGIMQQMRIFVGTGAYDALKIAFLPRARIGRSAVVRS